MLSYQSGISTPEKPRYICSFNNWGRKSKLPDGSGMPEVVEFREQTEADARAKMLIYLLENHLISLGISPGLFNALN